MSLNISVSQTLPQLPPRFKERVADLELRLEEECSLALVRGLMELYSQSIEYFESVSDLSYKQYQGRLQALLLRKDVQNVLAKPAEVKRLPLGMLRNSQRVLGGSSSAATLTEKRSVEKFLDIQARKASEVKRNIQENLRAQKENFQHKLRERQTIGGRTMMVSPMTSPKGTSRFVFPPEYDKCGGQTKSALTTYEYERELERIMEDHINSRFLAFQNIETSHNTQISKLASLPKSAEILKLMEAMQTQKQSEIETVFRELEAKKTQKVKYLKQRLLI